MKGAQNTLSVVIPAYNEEKVITETITQVQKLLTKSNITHEIIIVNDGSEDKTLDLCIALKKNYNFRIINLGKNSGHMAAIMAGLEASQGNLVATMDSDLQDPPEDLISMYEVISRTLQNQGSKSADVIQSYRKDRTSDTFFKRITADLYYRVIKIMTGIQLIPHAADFRIMTREVVQALIESSERIPIYRILIPKMGFKIEQFAITRQKRFAGETKYKLLTMIRFFIDSILIYSHKPLRSILFIGLSYCFWLFPIFATLLSISLVNPITPGWLSVIFMLISLFLFLFIGISLIGGYWKGSKLKQVRDKVPWHEIV
jgi:dolichol-phosphate mannosyltransferase